MDRTNMNLLISEFKVNRLYKYVGAQKHAVYKNGPRPDVAARELVSLEFGDIVLCVEEPTRVATGNSDRYGLYASYTCHVLCKDTSVWLYCVLFENMPEMLPNFGWEALGS